jgi:Mg2+ and Co2+ transporter CorA
MNAKITYTVELDSVPQTVAELLEKCKKELSLANDQLLGPHSEKFLTGINNARSRLALVDANLSDIASIYSGFMQARSEMMAASLEDAELEVGDLEEAEDEFLS